MSDNVGRRSGLRQLGGMATNGYPHHACMRQYKRRGNPTPRDPRLHLSLGLASWRVATRPDDAPLRPEERAKRVLPHSAHRVRIRSGGPPDVGRGADGLSCNSVKRGDACRGRGSCPAATGCGRVCAPSLTRQLRSAPWSCATCRRLRHVPEHLSRPRSRASADGGCRGARPDQRLGGDRNSIDGRRPAIPRR